MTVMPNLSIPPTAANADGPFCRSRFAPAAEALEPRIAPAVIAAPGSFTFTDADGDRVQVQLAGTGSAEFRDAALQDVALGGHDIDSVSITGAAPNFSLTFSDANPGVGGDSVALGKIGGAPGKRVGPIAGIFTLQSSAPVSYHLTGYFGTKFAPGGGLQILGSVEGAVLSGGGVDLLELPAGTSVFLRDGVAAGGSVKIAGKVAGSFVARGDLDGAISFFSVTPTADIQLGKLAATLTIEKNFAGHLGIAETAGGLIDVSGSLLAPAKILASGDLNLRAASDVTAQITAAGDIALTAGRHIIAANVFSGEDLTLKVGRNVVGSNVVAQNWLTSAPGERIGKDIVRSVMTGGNGLLLEVGRDVSGSRLSGGALDVDLAVAGKLVASRVSAGGRMDLTIGGEVTGGTLLSDGPFEANILGALGTSQLGSKESTAEVTVSGTMSGSRVHAGEDATISVGQNFVGSQVTGTAHVEVDVTGSANGIAIISGGSLDISVLGNLGMSSFFPGNALVLEVTGNLNKIKIETEEGDAEVSAGGSVSALALDSGAGAIVSGARIGSDVIISATRDVTVTAVGGAPLAADIGARIATGGNLTIEGAGAFTGAIAAGRDLTMHVGSIAPVAAPPTTTPSPTPSPTAPAVTPALPQIGAGIHIGGDLRLTTTGNVTGFLAEVGGDVRDFHIGGSFGGRLRAVGDFAVGASTDLSTIVIARQAGSTTSTALISIGGDFGTAASSPKLVFGGFLGRIQAQGKLLTDLQFTGSVNRLAFSGGIGAAPLGDNIAEITVNGTLGTLGSPNFFAPSLDKKSGNFTNGASAILGKVITTKGLLSVKTALF